MFGRKRDNDDVYIGTTTQEPRTRFYQHKKEDSDVGQAIRDNDLNFEDNMDILADGLTKPQAYDLEKELRPKPGMGLNKRSGGGGIPDGKPVTVYGIHTRKPGLTKRFVKWIFRMGK